MKQFFTILILMFILPSLHASAEGKKIIKWVDKNGVTQYGDRPPMPSKTNKSSVLNKQGVTVEKIEHKKTTAVEDKALANRARHDNALLASYNSIEEIEIARKRNTKIDELTLAALEDKKTKLNLQLQKNNQILLDFAKQKKTVPTDTTVTIERDMAAIKKLESDIKSRKAAIEQINKRYEKDKLRYAELESRKQNLNDIQYSKSSLSELMTWRADAQKRLNTYEAENLRYTRKGVKVPRNIREGLVSTTKEVENANKEIAAIKQAIKQNKTTLSK